jgi:hypothetical protein
MHEMTSFEQEFAARLQREVEGVREFDPAAIATAAIGRRTVGDRLANWMGTLGLAGVAEPAGTQIARRVALLLVVVLLAVAIVAAVGSFLVPPRGDRPLAILTAANELALARADGSEVVNLGSSPLWGGTSQVRIAPDARHVALIGGMLDFAMVDQHGAVTLLDTERRWSRQVAWAPDSGRFAMLSGKSTPGASGLIDIRLVIAAPDGSDPWTPALPGDASYAEDFNAIAWSPDGRTIVVTGHRLVDSEGTGRMWIVDVATKTVRERVPARDQRLTRWASRRVRRLRRPRLGDRHDDWRRSRKPINRS